MFHADGPSAAYKTALPPVSLLTVLRRNLRERSKHPVELRFQELDSSTEAPTPCTVRLVVQHIYLGLVPESVWPGAYVQAKDADGKEVELIIPGEALNGELDFILIKGL